MNPSRRLRFRASRAPEPAKSDERTVTTRDDAFERKRRYGRPAQPTRASLRAHHRLIPSYERTRDDEKKTSLELESSANIFFARFRASARPIRAYKKLGTMRIGRRPSVDVRESGRITADFKQWGRSNADADYADGPPSDDSIASLKKSGG